MGVNEFIAYSVIKNYFKYCLKEYVFRIVGIDIKIVNVKSKLKKQFKQLHVDASACLCHDHYQPVLALLQKKSEDSIADTSTDALSLVNSKYLKVVEKTLRDQHATGDSKRH